jgi:hypothetical protein
MTALAWIAGKDGLAHAARPGHHLSLCGIRAVDPRWAWPANARCADCAALELWATVHCVAKAAKADPAR